MTRKRFFKLRQSLVTKLYIKNKEDGYDAESLHKMALNINRMPQPILEKCGGSYSKAWEHLKLLVEVIY